LEALRRIRTMHGMNQVDLAKASGVAQNTISEIELGKREARPGTLKKLADALDVEISELFGDTYPLVQAPPEIAGNSPEERAEIAGAMAHGIEGVSDAYRRSLGEFGTGGASPDDLFTLHLQASFSLIGAQTVSDAVGYSADASVRNALEHFEEVADDIQQATTAAEEAKTAAEQDPGRVFLIADLQRQKAS
jgi:transcriptional regulator with XRE-family HTH domain